MTVETSPYAVGMRMDLERLGLVPVPSVSLCCAREAQYRQHRYLGAVWHPGADPSDPLSGSIELVYQCRLCETERVLGVLILCGPRPPRTVVRARPGRPRKVEG